MVESCLDFNMVHTRIQLVGNVNFSVFSVIYSLPLTDKYETENQKSDTKRRAVLDGAGTFLGQVHPPLQNIPKVMYGLDNAGAGQTDVPSSTSFVRFEEFAKNLWPHTLSKFFS